jgi:hypothetical protein
VSGLVSRLFSALLVGLLSLTTGGIVELVLPEPCSASEAAPLPSDGTCPPTCVRCHCARAFDLVLLVRAADPATPAPDWHPAVVSLPLPIPHDILHVPKTVLN